MANPLGTEYLSIPLRNFSVAQMQSTDTFVARRLLTKVPVEQQTAEYYVYPVSDWVRSEVAPLGRGSESAGSGWHLSDDTYNAKVYAIHKDNDAQDYANANAAKILDLDQDATAYVTEQIQIFEDLKFRDTFMPSAGNVWTVEFDGVSSVPNPGEFLNWNNPNSTPMDDVGNEIVALATRNMGRRPNVLIVNPITYQALRRNPQIMEAFQFTQGTIVTDQMLATALGVERIEVAWSMVNEGKEGLADDIGHIFGNNALLAYFAPGGGPKTNTAGAIFTWTAMDGGSSIGTRVDRIPAPLIHSIRIEGMAAFDMKIVNAKAATLFNNVLELS